ncbi:AMP-binding protein [Actinomadura fibrosa]|uniref:AMP-binding protein n=1 Tax=Actinomadura fibrosa TaxID=111802 RepID=A0ABW2XLG7_9ACTN|nr:AMP-binding protein [Actinomadura fibrosa]
MAATRVSADERIGALAARHPHEPAVVTAGRDGAGDSVLTWAELDEASAGLARRLRGLRAGAAGPFAVVVDAANSAKTVVEFAACMRAGVPFLARDPLAPAPEARRVLAALAETHRPVLADDLWKSDGPGGIEDGALHDDGIGGDAGYLLATGGSSGNPRLVRHPGALDHDPARVPNAMLRAVGWTHGQRQLIVGPLHHAAPFMCCWEGLLDANTLVLLPRFDARLMLAAMERHAIQWAQLAPVHMAWALHALRTGSPDLRSLRAVVHTAAPCPPELKRAWIDLVGPERLYEVYGATEAVGTTLLDGREWLAHPGSVGRGFCTQIRVLDEAGRPVPAGTVGEVFMRRTVRRGSDPTGHGLRRTLDGFLSVGDFGRLDADGYLYLAPRRHDMVIVGGGNVYPAEVEGVLSGHPDVLDVAVVGEHDELLGSRLVALVVGRPGAEPDAAGIAARAAARLAPHKVPWDVRFVTELPRTGAGKLLRRRLAGTEGSVG